MLTESVGAKKPCSSEGCEKLAIARGLCPKHYARLRSLGPLPSKSPEQRFWANVEKSESCWLWRGHLSTSSRSGSGGYGLLCVSGKKVYAHRFSFILHGGHIPDGLQLDHKCRVRNCCNPDHLEPVTQRENLLRGESPSAKSARRSRCSRGHLYTPENTAFGSKSVRGRICLECRKISNKKFNTKYRLKRLSEKLEIRGEKR